MKHKRITPPATPKPVGFTQLTGSVCINGETLTFAELDARYPGWHLTGPATDGKLVLKPSAGQCETIEPHRMN